QVGVDEVEAAAPEAHVAGGDVHDHLVARLHRPRQVLESDRGAPHPGDVHDDLRVRLPPLHRHHRSAPQREAAHALCATIPSVTSSIVSSAAIVTRSSGSWFCSVPLATFRHGSPRAWKAWASLPPPVATQRGSIPRRSRAAVATSTAGAERGSR